MTRVQHHDKPSLVAGSCNWTNNGYPRKHTKYLKAADVCPVRNAAWFAVLEYSSTALLNIPQMTLGYAYSTYVPIHADLNLLERQNFALYHHNHPFALPHPNPTVNPTPITNPKPTASTICPIRLPQAIKFPHHNTLSPPALLAAFNPINPS